MARCSGRCVRSLGAPQVTKLPARGRDNLTFCKFQQPFPHARMRYALARVDLSLGLGNSAGFGFLVDLVGNALRLGHLTFLCGRLSYRTFPNAEHLAPAVLTAPSSDGAAGRVRPRLLRRACIPAPVFAINR